MQLLNAAKRIHTSLEVQIFVKNSFMLNFYIDNGFIMVGTQTHLETSEKLVFLEFG